MSEQQLKDEKRKAQGRARTARFIQNGDNRQNDLDRRKAIRDAKKVITQPVVEAIFVVESTLVVNDITTQLEELETKYQSHREKYADYFNKCSIAKDILRNHIGFRNISYERYSVVYDEIMDTLDIINVKQNKLREQKANDDYKITHNGVIKLHSYPRPNLDRSNKDHTYRMANDARLKRISNGTQEAYCKMYMQ